MFILSFRFKVPNVEKYCLILSTLRKILYESRSLIQYQYLFLIINDL